MNPDEEIVELETAPSAPIAEMLASLLRAEGIPTYVDGVFLQDEWAMSQKILGRVNVKLQVPRRHLERARRVLQEARDAGRRLSDDQERHGADDRLR